MGGFDPPPLIPPECSHYTTMICRELNLERVISYTGGVLFRALYHRVVSINRPSGYEPDALPLRHDDVVSLGGFDPPPLTLRSSVRSHYATMTRLICAPSLNAFPSHISVTSIFLMCPSSYYIIGLFRSTVLQVMSLTRFLCATMIG
jgi:hypothetical protein